MGISSNKSHEILSTFLKPFLSESSSQNKEKGRNKWYRIFDIFLAKRPHGFQFDSYIKLVILFTLGGILVHDLSVPWVKGGMNFALSCHVITFWQSKAFSRTSIEVLSTFILKRPHDHVWCSFWLCPPIAHCTYIRVCNLISPMNIPDYGCIHQAFYSWATY